MASWTTVPDEDDPPPPDEVRYQEPPEFDPPPPPSCHKGRSRSSGVMHVTPELEVLGSNPGAVGTHCPRS